MRQSKMNERLHDMIPNRILLDINVSPKKVLFLEGYNIHLSLIGFILSVILDNFI